MPQRTLLVLAATLFSGASIWLAAQQQQGAAAQIAIDADDIAGVVSSDAARRPACGSLRRPRIRPPSCARSS